jgi:periplasmic copper chaperone A
VNGKGLIAWLLAGLAPALVLAGGHDPVPHTACDCPQEIRLAEPAWVRLPPPGLPVTAAYMALANNGGTDLAVTGAESPVAGVTELHEHVRDEAGVMRMRQVASMPLPAGGALTLEPGGLHLMLIDLNRALLEGEHLPLTLHLADGRSLEVSAEVRRGGPAPMHHGHH